MKVLITIPAFGHHGGLVVITQWANRLAKYHTVYLYVLNGKHNNPSWCTVDPAVTICGPEKLWEADIVILTSPHSAPLIDLILPHQKCFMFLQMMEHMFRPWDVNWMAMCKKFYQAPFPMFSISKWNMNMLYNDFRRYSSTIKFGYPISPEIKMTNYITNGIDLDQFPISRPVKDGRTVLVEGWEPGDNPTKDTDNIGPKVAARLRDMGYHIIAFSGLPFRTMKNVPNEYHKAPDLKTMNELYSRATILIKATHCDARSTAPIEAMTKGCAVVRAIDMGDDDLSNGEDGIPKNCWKSPYNEEELFQNAVFALQNPNTRNIVVDNAYRHIKENCNWDKVIANVNSIIVNS
jgi:hypothetical protein